MHHKIIILVIVVCFVSCSKEPQTIPKGPNCSDTQTKYISSEISNFKFKKGTYWVFVDSVTMQTDTLRIDTTFSGLVKYQYCPDNYHEIYSFTVNERVNLSSNRDVYSLDKNLFMVNQKDEQGIGSVIYNDQSPEIDSVFVYDRYYKHVVVTSLGSTGNTTVYYINTNYGLLKREIYSGAQMISKKILKDKFIVR